MILAPVQLEKLAGYDSPTIANAVEAIAARDCTDGYASMDLRCIYPDLPPVVGYAVTVKATTTKPAPAVYNRNEAFWKAIEASPKPTIAVIESVGPGTDRSCHVGDMMATLAKRMGVVAFVCSGGVRDVQAVREEAPGMQMFARGLVVAHGIPQFIEVGCAVDICGMIVEQGDLLHGDASGLLAIPLEIADKVAGEAEKVIIREEAGRQFSRSGEFTLDAYIERHMKGSI
jgi:4-hydroxy-4-methyl-2-oxoglutarate aldolase